MSTPKRVRARPPLSTRAGLAGLLLAGILGGCAAPGLAQGIDTGTAYVRRSEGRVTRIPPPGAATGSSPMAVASGSWLEPGAVLETGRGARAEIDVGPALRLRVDADTRVRWLDPGPAGHRLQLLAGAIALRVATDAPSAVDVLAGPYRMSPMGPGQFRVDLGPAEISATAWQAGWQVDGPHSRVVLSPGQRLVLDLDGQRWSHALPAADRFAQWAFADDDERALIAAAPAPDVESLRQHGDWIDSPEWGRVWVPHTVVSGWAPYTMGQWTWVTPGGWLWVDAAPWGPAPYRSGQWVQWRERWVWAPGLPTSSRPVRPPPVARPHPPGPVYPAPVVVPGPRYEPPHRPAPVLPPFGADPRRRPPAPPAAAGPAIVVPAAPSPAPGFDPGRRVVPAPPPVADVPTGEPRRRLPEPPRLHPQVPEMPAPARTLPAPAAPVQVAPPVRIDHPPPTRTLPPRRERPGDEGDNPGRRTPRSAL